MWIVQCTYWLFITKWHTSEMWWVDQTNTGHHCPLKRGNTQPALHLAHNIYILKIEKTNITVLIEIHGFHNIARLNPRKYWGNPWNDKDFRANIANITNLEQI